MAAVRRERTRRFSGQVLRGKQVLRATGRGRAVRSLDAEQRGGGGRAVRSIDAERRGEAAAAGRGGGVLCGRGPSRNRAVGRARRAEAASECGVYLNRCLSGNGRCPARTDKALFWTSSADLPPNVGSI